LLSILFNTITEKFLQEQTKTALTPQCNLLNKNKRVVT
jgi:hypothetical protein